MATWIQNVEEHQLRGKIAAALARSQPICQSRIISIVYRGPSENYAQKWHY